MGYAWYLGLDMLFAIVGLVLLNLWKKNKMVGWIVAGGLCLASIAISLQQAVYWDMSYDVFSGAAYQHSYGRHMYTRPWHRFPGFCIGLMAPWALDAWEKRGLTRGSQPTSQKAKATVYFACILAWAVLAAVILLPHTNTNLPGRKCDNFGCWSRPVTVLFIVFNRPLWCVALLTLTLACYFDYLPIFNSMCSASFFTPLSNLTYGCYLMHPPIIKLLAGNARDYYTFSYADSLSRASVNLILAYTAATVLWCLVEKPFATMTSWLVPSKKGASGKSTSATAGAHPHEAQTASSFQSCNPSSLQGMPAAGKSISVTAGANPLAGQTISETAKKALLSQPQGDENC